MTGALNLSLRPLSSAMQSMAVKREGFISRYFRANNGVADYYQLLEPVTLIGDFEIEAECFITDLEFAPIFGGAQFGLRTDADGLLRFILPRTDLSLAPRYAPVGGHIVAAGKLNTVTARRSGTSFYVGLNGVEASSALSDVDASISFLYVAAVDVNNQGGPSARLFGGVTKLKTWVNGDRNTGELIHNLKFDNPNSIYQRNHAVAQGVELGFIASVLNSGWSFDGTAYNYSGDVFTFLGDTGRFEIGKSYLVDFTAVVNAGQLLVRQSTSGSNVFDTTVSGNFKVVITVADGSTDNVYFCSAFFDGARFAGSVVVNSIREFHGCEVVGGMPEDWFQVERQPHWDYWLDTENIFVPTAISSSWTDNGGGSFTKNQNVWSVLGEQLFEGSNFEAGALYQVEYTMPVEVGNMRMFEKAGNPAIAFLDAGIAVKLDVQTNGDSTGLWFDTNNSEGTTISDISFRRKMEIAQ